MLSFFFLYCSVDLGAILSFPTRRSSDLNPDPLRFFGRCPFEELVRGPGSSRQLADRRADPPLEFLDRKSTRLNSSHVAISYAVFCLKKKKTILPLLIISILCCHVDARPP